MIKRFLVAFTVLLLSVGTAAPAFAYEPVNIVHTERVQAGPYALTVGFSAWPVRAMQSLDFTFIPDGGIADKSGTFVRAAPSGAHTRAIPLARHPRKRDVWGLDVFALQTEGSWRFTFALDGPKGHGEAALPLTVLSQPGPPLALSWIVCALPFAGLIAFLVIAWRRNRNLAPVG